MTPYCLPYQHASADLRLAFAALQERVYPELEPDEAPMHDPALEALSFFVMEGSRVVSYAAVVRFPLHHGEEIFQAAGLSCVATDPDHRGRGLGREVVGTATRAILHSDADIALFTCDRPLLPFYQGAGPWREAVKLRLVGNDKPGALNSDDLGKAVLLRLLSEKARHNAGLFNDTTVNLRFADGNFI
ncbi:GNAT family N-acetyltransferase [Paludibacterium paludis]|nr:GNAT family N-acetyltransferase [Paludibacterium paludis]